MLTRNRLALVFAAVALPALIWLPTAHSQSPGRARAQDDDTYDWSTSWPGSRADDVNVDVVEALQGCWRLRDLRSDQLPAGRQGEYGYMLVTGRYLSIEIHGSFQTSGATPSSVVSASPAVSVSLSAGVHRFELDEWSNMTTLSLIGANTTSTGRVAFEPPETSRRFEIQLFDDSLTMTREDGMILLWERELDWRARTDIYGRELPPDEEVSSAGDEDGGEVSDPRDSVPPPR